MGLTLLKVLFASTILANVYSEYIDDIDDLSGQVAEEPVAPSMRNAVRDPRSRWPGGVVPIQLSGYFSQRELSMVQQAINIIEQATCVRLPLSGWKPYNQYLIISKESRSNICFTAHIGFPPPQLRPARILLGELGCIEMKVVLHELLHALGLVHMHQNYNRNQYLDVHYGNIREDRIDQFNFFMPGILTDFGLPYDYDSRMHYENKEFSKNNRPTLTAKRNPYRILSGPALSPLDIMKINMMYC